VELDALIYNVEQIALGALGSYASSFAAVPYDAPPQALRAAIEESRLAMDQALADPVLRYQLSEYREALTFAEKENARKLSSAAWAYHTLLPRALEGDLALMAQLEDMREFVLREYGVEALITERGWAEKQTEQRTLLPSVWRHV
jgi:hypothetical protein